MKVFFARMQNLAIDESPLIPVKSFQSDAGYDLFAYLEEPMVLSPGEWKLVPTGIRLCMSHEKLEDAQNYVAKVCSRSGLAFKQGVFVLNAPGIIDEDYTGEIKIILANFGKDEFVVANQMRVAQLVFQRVESPKLFEVSEEQMEALSMARERAQNGFGSTGK